MKALEDPDNAKIVALEDLDDESLEIYKKSDEFKKIDLIRNES